MAVDSTPPEPVAARVLRARLDQAPLWIPVHGTSMGPRFEGVDRVRVVACRRSPRPGELWAFAPAAPTDELLVVHRCIGRRSSQHLFQGDGNPSPDEPVPTDDLVGRVTDLDREGSLERPRFGHAGWYVCRALLRAGLRRGRRIAPTLQAGGRRAGARSPKD